VDLITTVAGVPGLLLLISSKLLHKFESFYTDLQIYKSFFEEQDDDSPPEEALNGSSNKASSIKKKFKEKIKQR